MLNIVRSQILHLRDKMCLMYVHVAPACGVDGDRTGTRITAEATYSEPWMRRNDIFRAMDDVFHIMLSSHRLFFVLAILYAHPIYLLRETYSARSLRILVPSIISVVYTYHHACHAKTGPLKGHSELVELSYLYYSHYIGALDPVGRRSGSYTLL